MKRDDDSSPNSWEKDPIWDLLRQSPSVQPRPSFVDDVVRSARLLPKPVPWWKRFALPLTVGGLASAATAAVAIMLILNQPSLDSPLVESEAPELPVLEALDDALLTEALVVAADYPAEFSDAELVALIVY